MWWSCCFSASSDDALLSPTNTGNPKCAGSGGTDDKNDTEPSDDNTTEQHEVG